MIFLAPDPSGPDHLFKYDPLIFLAGPIQGAVDWQSYAIRRLRKLSVGNRLTIASPRGKMPFHGNFDLQVDWETLWLNRTAACEHGCIMFWLAKESTHRCDRAFAQTSRFELGWWAAKHARIVVGIEKGFTGERYIRRRQLEFPWVPICTTITQTCAVAYELATREPVSWQEFMEQQLKAVAG